MGLLTKETAKELSKIKASDQGSSSARPLYGWEAAKAHANAQAKLQASDAAWGPGIGSSNSLKNASHLVSNSGGTKSPFIICLFPFSSIIDRLLISSCIFLLSVNLLKYSRFDAISLCFFYNFTSCTLRRSLRARLTCWRVSP